MESDFKPLLYKLYVLKKHTLLFLTSGQGIFQVDFKTYHFNSQRVIFLSPGQYFQLLSGGFTINRFEIPEEMLKESKNSRYLFKHIISLGYIDFKAPKKFNLNFLSPTETNIESSTLLADSIEDWINLNPFKASQNNINLLFDLKDIIDENFREPISLDKVSKQLDDRPYRIKVLTRDRLVSTLQKLRSDRILLEIQRKIVFTEQSAKQIAYETGFSDPAYFNRFFKQQTSLTTSEFRNQYSFEHNDTFLNEFLTLVDSNFKKYHTLEFYAGRLNMTEKQLSIKVQNKLHMSFKHLIAQKILTEAKKMLLEKIPVFLIGFELGFKEPNHFSSFFKKHSGISPSLYFSDF